MILTVRSAPLYWRILRLRRLRPSPVATFLMFEGSMLLGFLLFLAEVVSGWGALAVPVAVAVMVKLNDVVVTTLYLRPMAEAQLRAPRIQRRRFIGVSRVPPAARMTAFIHDDDAVDDDAARPDESATQDDPTIPAPRPTPGSHESEPPAPEEPAAEAPPPDEQLEEAPRGDGVERRGRGNQGRFAF